MCRLSGIECVKPGLRLSRPGGISLPISSPGNSILLSPCFRIPGSGLLNPTSFDKGNTHEKVGDRQPGLCIRMAWFARRLGPTSVGNQTPQVPVLPALFNALDSPPSVTYSAFTRALSLTRPNNERHDDPGAADQRPRLHLRRQ